MHVHTVCFPKREGASVHACTIQVQLGTSIQLYVQVYAALVAPWEREDIGNSTLEDFVASRRPCARSLKCKLYFNYK